MTRCRTRCTPADRRDNRLSYLVALGLVAGAVHPAFGVVAVLIGAMILAVVAAPTDERNTR